MTKTFDQLHKELSILRAKHDLDPDLADHEIGKDELCLYCEQYNELLKELKILNPTEKRAIEKETAQRAMDGKALYEVTLKNGDAYMIFATGENEMANLLKIHTSDILKTKEIVPKYWSTTYVEQENGSLATVKSLLTTRRSRIVSKQDLSTNQEVRHYCYNETPFEYMIVDSERFDLVERFVRPYEAVKTKKFNKTGRITLMLPTGTVAVGPGEILMKITRQVFVIIQESDFREHFSEEENLVWKINQI